MALVRYGPLVSRFSMEIGKKDDRSQPPLWIMDGRDSREKIILASARNVTHESFFSLIESGRKEWGSGYQTIYIHREKIPRTALRDVLNRIMQEVDSSITLNETVRADSSTASLGGNSRLWEAEWENVIEYALFNSNYNTIKRFFHSQFRSWYEKKTPLILVETAIKELLHLIQNKNPDGSRSAGGSIPPEILLELYFSEFENPDTLQQHIWSLIQNILGSAAANGANAEIPEFFKAICLYIDKHYKKNLRLADLSDLFHLSQSYISRLFAKYQKCSFSEYLRKCRINAAKQIIRLQPDMPLQEVAYYCGFEDPFYFSKVFKAETGQTPSLFKRGC